MGQKKPRRSVPPAAGLLNGDIKHDGVWLAITQHLVVLDDQAHIMFTGPPEFVF